MKQQVVHLAHQRNPEGTLYEARCGQWNPPKVTSFINLVTCKRCLRFSALIGAKT